MPATLSLLRNERLHQRELRSRGILLHNQEQLVITSCGNLIVAGELGGAGAVVLALAEIVSMSVRFATADLGISRRPVHDAPFLSRTLAEFWRTRWNPATARWLKRHCFQPLARHGTAVALCATFSASAALHVYLLSFAAGIPATVSWGAFFLAQPIAVLVEKRLHVRTWTPLAGRIWTMGSLLILWPLLLIPALGVLHLTL